MNNKYIPWVEKYRPTKFEQIVLEETNKILLNNIVKTNNFPNLLFYGPPGTGKTTTIINLIDNYQIKFNQKRKGLKIHLNASDDRGIDIIRNQINQFVNTKTLFGSGMKFVVLDEVDYMTKNAQQALRYLIQQYSGNIRFCLICNYISRIDLALQNEFVRLRFCKLPEKEIFRFLNHIIKQEKLNISNSQIKCIQKNFKSDIRSMINYIQSNHDSCGLNLKVIENNFWENLIQKFKIKNSKEINKYIISQCINYNIGYKEFINKFLVYIIQNKDYYYSDEWMEFIDFCVHNGTVNETYLLNYFILSLSSLYNKE
jgi:DNA polymerase III delta prime subunit